MSSSPISSTGRSTTFPFQQIIPPEHTIPRYTISSERDTGMNMDMECQGQSYPLAPDIDLAPSSSSTNDNNMVWNTTVQGEILGIADQDVEEGTEVNSDDEFDASLLRSRPQAQTFVSSRTVTEEEGTVVSPQETNGIISIELSSSSSSSLSFTTTPTEPTNGVSVSVESKTTVLSLEEISSPEVATPLPSSRPGHSPAHRRGPSFDAYIPKSTHSPSSSGDEYEEEEPEPEVVSRNGRYPARLNTLKNQEQKKRNKKVQGRGKGKAKAKSNGMAKAVGSRLDKGKGRVIGKLNKRSSSESSYKGTSGGVGRSAVGVGGSKVPTGAFLFWMMKMLAYDVFPEHVILKNQVAYIPNTEAFAEHVYSVLSKKTNQWTSFQRNLNNYIKDWPFERRAVANTDLMSQTIEIPTIDELSLAWRNHGLNEQVFEEQKRELEMWVKEHKATRTVSRIKAPKEVEFKRKSVKFDRLCGKVEVGMKKGVKVIETRSKVTMKGKSRSASLGRKGAVDEEVDELYSEEEAEPSQSQSAEQDNPPLEATSSSPSSSVRPFWMTAATTATTTPPKNKTSGDRSITRIDSSEKLHLRLRLDGSTWSVTPEKPKEANKRKFGCLSEGEGEEEDGLTYPREIYTPSPSFTNPLITPQTATEPTFAQPSSSTAGYWANINNQLRTPISMPKQKQARFDVDPLSVAGPSYSIEMSGSSRDSFSSGGLVENDVFGPVIEVGEGRE
ncbi:hypothetical protein I302_103101 [Kwoniella bestiolae CBS 10118]|uniref:Uncharacterized protein n=1 Tax=Kwoniella bestiolae CBS 10118 TaxID=1296100 RepID=A0A1B9GGV7_9TREE|nr:hypothetical protein I302_01802 [Kwoniella bestiolae CBS 10118]OCF30283.1 hypothetical protein I302_01802 [Kwoniella bestiolae CBS 10118]